jgi:hypothetical protein
MGGTLVIIDDLDIVGMSRSKSEADSPLVIDADAVLAVTIAAQLLQTISRRDAQIVQRDRGVKLQKFSQGDSAQIPRPALDGHAPKQLLGLPIPEAADHGLDSNASRY